MALVLHTASEDFACDDTSMVRHEGGTITAAGELRLTERSVIRVAENSRLLTANLTLRGSSVRGAGTLSSVALHFGRLVSEKLDVRNVELHDSIIDPNEGEKIQIVNPNSEGAPMRVDYLRVVGKGCEILHPNHFAVVRHGDIVVSVWRTPGGGWAASKSRFIGDLETEPIEELPTWAAPLARIVKEF